jgi:hypothetical protein
MTASGVTAESVSASDALDDKQEAERLLAELERMDDRPEVSVSQSTLEAVQYNVDRGTLDYTNENYAAASDSFAAASEQARAELTDAYLAAAGVELDAAETRVAAVTERGYQTDRTASLTAQIATKRTQLASVDSYSEARAAFEDAQSLRMKAASLPTASSVSTADTIEGIVDNLPLIIGGGVVAARAEGGDLSGQRQGGSRSGARAAQPQPH